MTTIIFICFAPLILPITYEEPVGKFQYPRQEGDDSSAHRVSSEVSLSTLTGK